VSVAALSLGRLQNLFFRVWLPLACSNQAPQTAVYIGAPGVRADVETFVFGNQTQVSEVDLRLIALSRDLEADLRSLPLALVSSEIEEVVQDMPDDFLAGDLCEVVSNVELSAEIPASWRYGMAPLHI